MRDDRSLYVNICLMRRRVIAAAAAILTLTAVSAGMMISSRAGSDDAHTFNACYRSIHIQEGDTLLSIAQTYNDGLYMDDAEYVRTVKLVNQIGHDDIHPGCYLVVPDFK